MHKLLERQIRKNSTEAGGLDVQALLRAVSSAYDDIDADRRRTERSIAVMVDELDRSHSKLRDAIDVVPEGLLLSDSSGRVVIWNQKFLALYPHAKETLASGVAFDTVIRAGCSDVDQVLVESWLAARLQNTPSRANGLTLRASNHKWLRVEERATSDGGTITVFVDISDLKQREEWFRLLFDNNPVPMWVHDRHHLTILVANNAAAAYFRCGIDDLIGRTILDLKPTTDWDETRARASSEVHFYTVADARYQSADGRTLSADVFSRSIEYAGREARIVSAIDTTERRRAEAAKEEALAEAERLRIQEQAAAQAKKAKSSFLAVMSHEIRTPLNAVLGLATALLDTDLSDEQRLQLRTIYDAGDGLLTILNDILDYSKLEAGHVTLECNVFDVKDFIDTILSIAAPKAVAKDLVLTSSLGGRVPSSLLGDAARLRQVVLNFVSNAIKFTSAGEVRLDVTVVGLTAGQPIIEWKVTDTGIGISQDQLGRLFNDYVQADTTINRRFGGTGLGLAISKRIVSQMGGEVFISSTLGEGTTVGCRVPLAVSAVATPAPQKSAHSDINGADLPILLGRLDHRASILVVDDNATNRLVATKLLGGLDVRVDAAANGLEAVAAAGRHRYDAILMDMRMPEMDGLEATRAIRASGGPSAGTAIIAFTANAFSDDVEACMTSGMDAFVAKPVRKPQLHAVLAKVLTNRRDVTGRDDRPAPDMPARMDPSQILELEAEVGAEGVAEMIASFLEETEQRLSQLKAVAWQSPSEQLSREAHTIKGSAGIFGAVALAEAARDLEFAAKSGCEAAEAARLAKAVEARFEETKTFLRSKLAA